MTEEERIEDDPDDPESLGRVLMAVAHILGIWDQTMLVPNKSRSVLVLMKNELGQWATDERGYPMPSPELLMELEYLRAIERPADGRGKKNNPDG